MIEELSIPSAALVQMRAHARATYPEECCGFLVGTTQGPTRVIHRVEAVANQVGSERERRYIIPPAELRALEASLEGSVEAVVGFYHSHPDHPARPSEFDREHAWPWYTYIVLSVDASGSGAIGAFELDDDTLRFRPVPYGEPPSVPTPNEAVSESS